ncbi:hypothetical protein C8J57DRAFT_1618039 [Mycena rebaudengoi]|nr:hypothetical protein C8J57DRAFT_1618039 [Mycena rebaudengoi]
MTACLRSTPTPTVYDVLAPLCANRNTSSAGANRPRVRSAEREERRKKREWMDGWIGRNGRDERAPRSRSRRRGGWRGQEGKGTEWIDGERNTRATVEKEGSREREVGSRWTDGEGKSEGADEARRMADWVGEGWGGGGGESRKKSNGQLRKWRDDEKKKGTERRRERTAGGERACGVENEKGGDENRRHRRREGGKGWGAWRGACGGKMGRRGNTAERRREGKEDGRTEGGDAGWEQMSHRKGARGFLGRPLLVSHTHAATRADELLTSARALGAPPVARFTMEAIQEALLVQDLSRRRRGDDSSLTPTARVGRTNRFANVERMRVLRAAGVVLRAGEESDLRSGEPSPSARVDIIVAGGGKV